MCAFTLRLIVAFPCERTMLISVSRKFLAVMDCFGGQS
jgi:hypothetical protein